MKIKGKANNPDMSAFLPDLASWQSLPKNSQSLKLFAIDQIVCHTNKQTNKQANKQTRNQPTKRCHQAKEQLKSKAACNRSTTAGQWTYSIRVVPAE